MTTTIEKGTEWLSTYFIDRYYHQTQTIPGRLLYAKVWGSYSHDTQLPSSDVDYLAVYQLPTRTVAGFQGYQDTVDHKGPDFQAHELGKFASLLLKGNPGIVECLFTEYMQWGGLAWHDLLKFRDDFINQQTLNQYVGYCKGQLQRLENGTRLHSSGGEYNTKWAYHLIRLAIDAVRIAQGEPPQVMKSDGERYLLMNIRTGNYTPEQIAEMWQEYNSVIEHFEHELPPKADESKLEEWVWQQRRLYLENAPII